MILKVPSDVDNAPFEENQDATPSPAFQLALLALVIDPFAVPPLHLDAAPDRQVGLVPDALPRRYARLQPFRLGEVHASSRRGDGRRWGTSDARHERGEVVQHPDDPLGGVPVASRRSTGALAHEMKDNPHAGWGPLRKSLGKAW